MRMHFVVISFPVVCAGKQSALISENGVLLTCGENSCNELGRSGKQNCFNRVDSLEAFDLCDITTGYLSCSFVGVP